MNAQANQDKTTFVPRADESTIAQAWASSALGDPTGSDAAPARRDPPAPPRTRRRIPAEVLAAAVAGAVGVVGAVGMIFSGDSGQPHPVSVTPAPAVAPPAPSATAVAPAPAVVPDNAPDNGPAASHLVNLPDTGRAPVTHVAPPPAAVARGASAPPQLHPVPPPLKLPPPPWVCLPPHHFVQGVCR